MEHSHLDGCIFRLFLRLPSNLLDALDTHIDGAYFNKWRSDFLGYSPADLCGCTEELGIAFLEDTAEQTHLRVSNLVNSLPRQCCGWATAAPSCLDDGKNIFQSFGEFWVLGSVLADFLLKRSDSCFGG